jgi:hypothetical protein
MRRDMIIMGERKEETRRRFEKGIYKNLFCDPNDLNSPFLCFEIL